MKKRAVAGLAGVCVGVWAGLLGGCVAGSTGSGLGGPEPVEGVSERLERDVRWLCETFPGRSSRDRAQINRAGAALAERLRAMGYAVTLEAVGVAGQPDAFNVVAELPGTAAAGEVVVVGAHYDAEVGTPGADDNASGVAAVLELARRFAGRAPARTIRWVLFTNEEWSNSQGSVMGSSVSAQGAKARGERVVAMLSLEMLGYYDETPGAQTYPFPRDSAFARSLDLPETGDFVAVVGRFADTELVDRLSGAMRSAGTARVAGAALPPVLKDIYRSDHAHYWFAGYPAVMVTDTSNMRNPHYHKASDTPDTLDYVRMAGVVDALGAGVGTLAGSDAGG